MIWMRSFNMLLLAGACQNPGIVFSLLQLFLLSFGHNSMSAVCHSGVTMMTRHPGRSVLNWKGHASAASLPHSMPSGSTTQ